MYIETIHESLVNGQRRQMVEQIDEYGVYDFWKNYKLYLNEFNEIDEAYKFFTDATISYFHIKGR